MSFGSSSPLHCNPQTNFSWIINLLAESKKILLISFALLLSFWGYILTFWESHFIRLNRTLFFDIFVAVDVFSLIPPFFLGVYFQFLSKVPRELLPKQVFIREFWLSCSFSTLQGVISDVWWAISSAPEPASGQKKHDRLLECGRGMGRGENEKRFFPYSEEQPHLVSDVS